MVQSMQQVTTITSEVYCEILKNCAGQFRKKYMVMLTPGVVLLHDNARPYTADRARALLEHLNWELSDHHSYSLDLAPSDYHLFYLPEEPVRMEGVKKWLSSQEADCFDTGIHKLIPRYDKCLNSGGDYAEK
jgi:histone-lysine N-methyltransferase SETMAR